MNGQNRNNSYNARQEVIEIDLRQILAAFVAQWKTILIVAVGCAVIAFAVCTFFVTPKYTAVTNILILNKASTEGQITNSDLTLSSNLSNDFVAIATSNTSKELINQREKIAGAKISASVVTNTRMIKIKVQHEDKEKAVRLADCVADVAAERICEIMDVPNMVRTVDKAEINNGETTPRTFRWVAIAGILGFLATWLLFVIIYLANDKINVPEDVERYLGVPILGTIPFYEARDAERTKRKKRKKSE